MNDKNYFLDKAVVLRGLFRKKGSWAKRIKPVKTIHIRTTKNEKLREYENTKYEKRTNTMPFIPWTKLRLPSTYNELKSPMKIPVGPAITPLITRPTIMAIDSTISGKSNPWGKLSNNLRPLIFKDNPRKWIKEHTRK